MISLAELSTNLHPGYKNNTGLGRRQQNLSRNTFEAQLNKSYEFCEHLIEIAVKEIFTSQMIVCFYFVFI